MSNYTLILASSSIYRRELLTRLCIPFTVESPDVDETPLPQESPAQTALRLAQAKARKVGQRHQNALIIGCDQVAVLDGLQLGKPLIHDVAMNQLRMMQGRTVVFHSAICIYNSQTSNLQSAIVPYEVKFRQLDDTEIERYLIKEQPYHCAGSAKSEGLGIALIEHMRGDDPNALIGLPLITLINMLKHEGVNVI
ncbi:MAG TPA: Maf family nucleotide pyrophosphatase [Methylophilaceae bacterium]|nr:Maf family nucleotide pyrophosphatase [Methylophilaceae bacterium]